MSENTVESRLTGVEKRLVSVEKELEVTAKLQQSTAQNLHILTQNVEAVVSIHQNVKGTITTIKAIQTSILWCMKWPLIVTGFYTAFEYLKIHLK